MENGFTHGPWQATDGSVDGYAMTIHGSELRSGGLPVIADIAIRREDETNANAHLIAAAPDLLEALEAIVSRLTNGALLDFDDAEVETARQAINRARGRV